MRDSINKENSEVTLRMLNDFLGDKNENDQIAFVCTLMEMVICEVSDDNEDRLKIINRIFKVMKDKIT